MWIVITIEVFVYNQTQDFAGDPIFLAEFIRHKEFFRIFVLVEQNN